MGDLIERLRNGCVLRPKRWSGDTHDDLGGSIDEAATDALMSEAAAALEAAREESDRWQSRYRAAIGQARGIVPEAGLGGWV